MEPAYQYSGDSNNGYDTRSDRRWFRLGGIRNVYASPVGAANRLYITDRQGTTLVMSHANLPKMLAVNRLYDSFSASAAVAGGELFLRGQRNLYCIAEE